MAKTDGNSTRESETNWLRIGLLCVVVVLVLWALNLVLALVVLSHWQERGTVGDTFGAVNALFAGLAFAGVIVTLFMQREELTLQREELQETRKELRRAADAQTASEAALREQVNQLEKTARISAATAVLTDLERSKPGMADKEAYARWSFRKRALELLIQVDVPEIGLALKFGDTKLQKFITELEKRAESRSLDSDPGS